MFNAKVVATAAGFDPIVVDDVELGWSEILCNLLVALSAHDGVMVNAIRNRFGKLRVEVSIPVDSPQRIRDVVYDLVIQAEELSAITCEKCGGRLIDMTCAGSCVRKDPQ